jgi:hypothetical protein
VHKDWAQFEKAVGLLAPKTKHLSAQDISPKDFKWLADVLKQLK